jgi:hypothetical protein
LLLALEEDVGRRLISAVTASNTRWPNQFDRYCCSFYPVIGFIPCDFIDSPERIDFSEEVIAPLRVTDGAVVIVASLNVFACKPKLFLVNFFHLMCQRKRVLT